jgi:hypothetical protein
MSKRKTIEEWQKESNKVHNNEFLIMDTPSSGQQLIRIFHKKCDNILTMRLNNHLKRYCKFCSKKHSRTLSEYQKMSNDLHNNEFLILEQPKNIKQKVKILHKKCDSVMHMSISNHINQKNGCKRCSKYSLKSNEYWVSKSKDIWGDDYLIMDEVRNVHKKVRILHTICNKEHQKSMNSFIHGARGCPYCAKNDLKYAEDYISKYLSSIKVKFEREKTFEDLINPNTGRKLRFDFYLPTINTVIEVNGIQHYKPIDCWGGKESFEKQIYRDNLKKEFLENKNIKLIIINNKQLTKIKEIL